MKMNRLFYVALAGAFALRSGVSYALPLLAQSTGLNVLNALTLYPDSENPNLFYFMPNSSEFARERSSGLPSFGFTYWGLEDPRNTDAGGYMVFSMRLQSDADQKIALNAAIASGKQIAVLPVQESTIGITSTNTSAGVPLGVLFNEFHFSHRAGRAEDEVRVKAVLTKTGPKGMKNINENPAILKVDYCYKVQGLGPNFDASITVDWKRVYDDFQAHASAGGFWHRWSIDAEVEKLRENRIVQIEINGGNAKDEEYVKGVADQIVTKLFVPELQSTPTSSSGSGGWSFSRYSLKLTSREELKQEHWIMKRRDLVDREFCVPLVLNEIHNYKNQLVKNADGL